MLSKQLHWLTLTASTHLTKRSCCNANTSCVQNEDDDNNDDYGMYDASDDTR